MRTSKKQQKGLSLVELLVSVVIGLFLMGGIITNFASSKDSDVTRAATSELDANARLAIDILSETIRHAGYSSIYNVRIDKPFYSAIDGELTNPACSDGSSRDEYTPREIDRTRDHSRGDRITVISLADNPCIAGQSNCPDMNNVNPRALVYTDCLGGGATRADNRVVSCSAEPGVGMLDPTQAKIFSSFYLGGGNDKHKLFCRGSRGGTQAIAENVRAIQLLYGVKQLDGRTIYRNADRVEAAQEWGLVNSVQVSLLMMSPRNVLKEESDKTSYVLLDRNITIPSEYRRRLFRIYTTSINLENKNKDPL